MKRCLVGVSISMLVLAGCTSPSAAGAVRGLASSNTQASPRGEAAREASLTASAKAQVEPTRAFRPATVSQLKAHPRVPRSKAPFFLGGAHLKKPASTTTVAPSSAKKTTTTSSSGPHVAVYNGLAKDGIAASDNASQLTPPDSTGAIGPNHYVEMSNSIIHVWDRNLISVSSMSIDAFVGDPGGSYCDPQIQWDQAAGRWLYSVLMCDDQASPQFFLFGWSKASDPSNLASGWCTDLGFTTSSLIFDYDKLGHTGKWLIIGGNFYDASQAPPPFVGAGLAWIQLPASTVHTCPTTFPTNHELGPGMTNPSGANTFTPVPVNTDSTSSNGYILSAYDPSGNAGNAAGAQNRLVAWHVDLGGALHLDGDIPVSAYDVPPAAHQLGGGTLDTLDGRLTQAVGDPATGIWTQHTVAGGAGDKVTWYELKLGGLGVLTRAQEGDLSSATEDVYNAAISPSWSANGAVISYNRSSSSTNQVIAVRNRATATALNTMDPNAIDLVTSNAPDSDFSCIAPFGPPCRWGDYAGASPDPVNKSLVWGTNEYNKASTSAPAWRNLNFAITTWVSPGAPTGLTLVSSGTDFACLAWTAPASDGGAPIWNYFIGVTQGLTPFTTVKVGGSSTIGCVSGLSPGVVYTFRVLAWNAAGYGPESATVTGSATRATEPSTSTSSPARTGATQSSPAPSPPPR